MTRRALPDDSDDVDQLWLRIVDVRPLSAITTQFVDWCFGRRVRERKAALLLVLGAQMC